MAGQDLNSWYVYFISFKFLQIDVSVNGECKRNSLLNLILKGFGPTILSSIL